MSKYALAELIYADKWVTSDDHNLLRLYILILQRLGNIILRSGITGSLIILSDNTIGSRLLQLSSLIAFPFLVRCLLHQTNNCLLNATTAVILKNRDNADSLRYFSTGEFMQKNTFI